MKKLIATLSAGVILLSLSGCSYNSDVAAYNSNVASANSNGKLEFAAALAACGDSQGCLVGVSMAYAGNMGQQPYMKPETLSDQVRAWLPVASLGLQAFDLFYTGTGLSGTGSNGSFVITGDNNSLSGIGNNMEASGGSTVNAPFSSSNSFSWDAYNRKYNLGSGYDGAVLDTGVTGEATPVAEVTE